jgi:hypothetical protein
MHWDFVWERRPECEKNTYARDGEVCISGRAFDAEHRAGDEGEYGGAQASEGGSTH